MLGKGQNCAGTGHSDGQDDLRNRRRFAHSTQGFFGVQKCPHFQETEKIVPCNAAYTTMVMTGR
jgi:hypothetical protein